MVARERFELSSRAPEAPMLDRYTTGLQHTILHQILNIITLASNLMQMPGARAWIGNAVLRSQDLLDYQDWQSYVVYHAVGDAAQK